MYNMHKIVSILQNLVFINSVCIKRPPLTKVKGGLRSVIVSFAEDAGAQPHGVRALFYAQLPVAAHSH